MFGRLLGWLGLKATPGGKGGPPPRATAANRFIDDLALHADLVQAEALPPDPLLRLAHSPRRLGGSPEDYCRAVEAHLAGKEAVARAIASLPHVEDA